MGRRHKHFDWKTRIINYDYITEHLLKHKDGDRLCVNHNNNTLENNIHLIKRIGTSSKFGEAWRSHLEKQDIYVDMAIKKIPLEKGDMEKPFSSTSLLSNNSVWSEMTCYILCNILVFSKVCPNLPLYYKYFWCPKCHFMNRYITPKKQPCLLVLNELAEADLEQLWKQYKLNPPVEVTKSCMFQIFISLYALNKFYGMSHNDLHWGNVLAHKIEEGGYWEYTLQKKRYYVPNTGYLFVLWDFGNAYIKNKIKGHKDNNDRTATLENDVGHISHLMFRKSIHGNSKKFLKELDKRTEDYDSLPSIIADMFEEYTEKPDESEIIDRFNLDVTKAEVKKYVPTGFKKFIK